MTITTIFERLVSNISQYEALHIPSPSYQKRRAAVAIILRWRSNGTKENTATNVQEFFEQVVKQDPSGEPEILFMQRATRVGDRWSGHVSFIGGKNEENETDQETVEREVLEEIGIDLSSQDYIQLGKLDEREISSVKDNKLLMILIPFVYLQVVPESPPFKLQESEVAAVQWIPLSFFLSTQPYPTRQITEQLTLIRVDKNSLIKPFLKFMMGTVSFPAIDLPTTDSTQFRLWGLTMGMTRDLIEFTNLQQLMFVNLVNRKPIYSRPDIGYMTLLITQLTIYYKKTFEFITKKRSRINYGAKSEWDKVYFESIRKAVMLAILLRLGFTSVFIVWLIKKLYV